MNIIIKKSHLSDKKFDAIIGNKNNTIWSEKR